MTKFSTRKVDTHLLEYKDYLCSKESWVSITSWINGEGYDVSWTDGNRKQQMVSLTYADLNALVAAYHMASLPSDEVD